MLLALGPRTPKNTQRKRGTAETHDEFPFKITQSDALIGESWAVVLDCISFSLVF